MSKLIYNKFFKMNTKFTEFKIGIKSHSYNEQAAIFFLHKAVEKDMKNPSC